MKGIVNVPAPVGAVEFEEVKKQAHSHDNKTALDNLSQDVIDNSHSHTNKTALDKLTQDVINNSHSHDNKTELDKVTQDVITNSHSHDNKTELDKVTQDVITNSHSHDNKTELDKVTQDVITNSHSHDNKTALDNLTQDVIDNSHSHGNQDVLGGITAEKVKDWDGAAARFGSFPMISLGCTDITVTKISSTEVRIEFFPYGGMRVYGDNGNISKVKVNNLMEGQGLIAVMEEYEELTVNVSIDKDAFIVPTNLQLFVGVAPAFASSTGEVLHTTAQVYFSNLPYPDGLTGVYPLGRFIVSGSNFERGFDAYDSHVKAVGW